MLGPGDIEDWEFDRRDRLSLLLRRHEAIDGLARGSARNAPGLPKILQDVAARFARQDFLAMDDLEALAFALDIPGEGGDFSG